MTTRPQPSSTMPEVSRPDSQDIPRATLRDLAVRLKLSTAAVSLALRNHPSISEKTRELVHNEATRLDYRANPMVSALMAQVRRNRRVSVNGEGLGFLTSSGTPEAWRKGQFGECFAGADARAQELGFHLEPLWLGDRGAGSGRTAEILHARSMRGSILMPVGEQPQALKLRWEQHPVIAINHSFHQVKLNHAAHDQFQGIMTCYEQLHKKGYQRIALVVTKTQDTQCRHHWLAGFLASEWIHGLKRATKLVFMEEVFKETQFLRWFDSAQPDAIIDFSPSDAYRTLQKRGVKVPQELGYASLDLTQDEEGKIAGIRQEWKAIGSAAIDLLVNQLYQNESGLPKNPKVTVLKGFWCEGPTVLNRSREITKGEGSHVVKGYD